MGARYRPNIRGRGRGRRISARTTRRRTVPVIQPISSADLNKHFFSPAYYDLQDVSQYKPSAAGDAIAKSAANVIKKETIRAVNKAVNKASDSFFDYVSNGLSGYWNALSPAPKRVSAAAMAQSAGPNHPRFAGMGPVANGRRFANEL